MASSHSEVRDRSKDHNQSGDDVVEALLDGDSPGQATECNAGNDHENEDNPGSKSEGTALECK